MIDWIHTRVDLLAPGDMIMTGYQDSQLCLVVGVQHSSIFQHTIDLSIIQTKINSDVLVFIVNTYLDDFCLSRLENR